MTPPKITKEALIALYCKSQDCTPEDLEKRLESQKQEWHPIGFMLLKCEVFDSSRFGDRVILPFGPNNTFKEIPDHPISPRGLASDISVVEAWCEA